MDAKNRSFWAVFCFPHPLFGKVYTISRSHPAMQLASISGVLYSRAQVIFCNLTNAVRTPTWHKRVAT